MKVSYGVSLLGACAVPPKSVGPRTFPTEKPHVGKGGKRRTIKPVKLVVKPTLP